MSGTLREELPPDFEFGAYVIRECIGRGGMARIYRAEHGALRRSVALKVLDHWRLAQPTGGERFLREARAAAAIKHPHVVDILDVGVWGERPFIAMELLTGCDLDTHLDEYGTLSNGEIASLALPVIAGVMAVHDAGVVHRDLKPSNIFLSQGPEGLVVPKVLDFGVSKVMSSLQDSRPYDTRSRDIIGTPAYMAPEGLEGVGMLGPAGDQYAIGAVLYECAVGRPPFEGKTLLGLLKALAVGDIERPSARRPDLLPQLERVILRAIERDPNDRFGSLREMGRELWPFADERTKTVWEHCFANGKSAGQRSDGTPAWMGFRIEHVEKSRRSWSGREGWRSGKWLPSLSWLGPLAVASALLLIAGGVLLDSDAPAPVASTVTGTAVQTQTDEASLAQLPAEAGASRPTSPGGAENAVEHAEPAAASDRLTTVTEALRPASAESTPRVTQSMKRNAPPRRNAARKTISREPRNARAEAALNASPAVNGGPASGEEDPFTELGAGARGADDAVAENELDGLFPGSETFGPGANRAPIPD